MPDEGCLLYPYRVHEGVDISGEVVGRVATSGFIRLPVPALVRCEGVVLVGDQGEHPTKPVPRVGVRMEKDDRFPLSIAPLGVAQPQTRREADRGDLQIVRLVYGLPPLRPAFPYGSYVARMMPPGGVWCPTGDIHRSSQKCDSQMSGL